MVDVVEVRPLEGYRLYLRFEDGAEGEVDVSGIVTLEGVFGPRAFPDLGTVAWPQRRRPRSRRPLRQDHRQARSDLIL